MKTIKHVYLSAAILLLAATGCIDDFTIRGNGIDASEGRIVTHFEQVKSEGPFDVHITSGDEFDVVVSAESNLLPYIETDVYRNVLRLYVRGLHNLNNRLPIEIFVTTPFLEGITQSGSGSVTTGYFVSDDFDVKISGSGSIETATDASNIDAVISGSGGLLLSGSAAHSDLTVSGSGTINAYNFAVSSCDANISGSGNIMTNVEDFLKVSISGSGNVFYIGSPEIESHISGSGNVIHENDVN